MTIIRRMRIPVAAEREWVSVIPGADNDRVLVVRQSGEELQIGIDAEAPLEPQIARELESRSRNG